MKKRLAVVIYGLDNPVSTELSVKYAKENSDNDLTDVILVDNGSTIPYGEYGQNKTIIYEKNIGGNAVFHRWEKDCWLEYEPEFIAFIHCDLYIRQKDYDKLIIAAFDTYPSLALQGFVGSSEIDERGGRGGGTCLNFMGDFYEGIGQASPAEAHGRREKGISAAAVLDHCSMIFRTSVLKQLPSQEEKYAPEHFYDRILSCHILQRGLWIAVNGILCDHISGGIGPGIEKAHELRMKWLVKEGLVEGEKALSTKESHDMVYVESEKRFFSEFKDKMFPVKVAPGTHRLTRI